MIKEEFEAHANTKISEEDFAIINEVYSFHPCISETDGKEQVATLYEVFGMRIFKDMISTARQAEMLESDLRKARVEVEQISEELRRLKY